MCDAAAHRGTAFAETLIVLNKGEASAWLVDPTSGEVRAKLAVGQGPHEAAVSPDGKTVVVCNYGLGGVPGSTLSVIDLPSRRVTRTISLAPHARPHGIAYGSGGAEVFVTSETSRAILRVNVAAGKVVAAHDAGVDAHLLALSEDGARVYGAGVRQGALGEARLRGSGGASAGPRVLSTGAGTEAIAIRPGGGEIWVGSNDLDRIAVVDPKSFRIVAEIPCGLTPIRLAFTPDGKRALATCAVSGDLAVIDATRRAIERRIPLSDVPLREGARPIGVLVAPDAREAYVACNARDEVAVVDLGTWSIVRRIPTGRAPDGMAWSVLN
ncbi:MAG TPA: YncE family protein [Acidobacteriota bacterium]|nr:YncE family protein [Acidobacteriota bacterium]